jgi:hypothetical protein
MTDAKKQHYVPQFYLRGFANQSEQIHVFDKFTQKSSPAKVNNVAASNYFYDLSEDIVEVAERLKGDVNTNVSAEEIDAHMICPLALAQVK